MAISGKPPPPPLIYHPPLHIAMQSTQLQHCKSFGGGDDCNPTENDDCHQVESEVERREM